MRRKISLKPYIYHNEYCTWFIFYLLDHFIVCVGNDQANGKKEIIATPLLPQNHPYLFTCYLSWHITKVLVVHVHVVVYCWLPNQSTFCYNYCSAASVYNYVQGKFQSWLFTHTGIALMKKMPPNHLSHIKSRALLENERNLQAPTMPLRL